MKKILVFLATLFILVGCGRAPSNVYVLSTGDCGASWEKLDTGARIPKHTANPCGYNTAIPNWPMAGETEFKTQFDKKVLTNAKLSYTYAISNPIVFIGEARYLGKMGGSLEISSDSIGNKYEMAENIIVDKLLREITTEATRKMDVVDANPAEIEEAIYKAAKEQLDQRGVTIADLALIIDPDEQTRLAIDTATAIRVYEAANIRAVGENVIVARSGATKITVETNGEKR